MRRRIVLFAAVLILGSGCGSTTGPREMWRDGWFARGSNRPDLPGYTLDEQEQRGRARFSTPTDNFKVGPSTQMGGPDPVFGR